MIEYGREEHKSEVERYLQRRFGGGDWALRLPRGSGHETYVAEGDGRTLFVKLGAEIKRGVAMGAAGLSPGVVDAGELDDGTVVLVQEWVEGRHPQRGDYQEQLEDVARIIGEMHRNEEVKGALPRVASEGFAEAGLRALGQVRSRWEGV